MIRKIGFILLPLLIILVLGKGQHAHGATVRALTLDGLTLKADIVVLAEATDIRTHRDPSSQIVRSVTCRVDEYVVGSGSESVSVRLQGGVLGNNGRHVPGEIDIPIGQPVLLFLTRAPQEPDVFLVTGMAQGRFPIVTDEKTNEKFATRTLGKLHLLGHVNDDTFSLAEPETCTWVPLDIFLEEIRSILSNSYRR